MDTLSLRAQKAAAGESKLLSNFILVQKNSYDDESNPDGICNCGVAENYLCENELIAKLQTIQIWKSNHMYYPNAVGQLSLRKVLCDFFRKFFHVDRELDPHRMIISSGLSGVMSLLSYLIGNPYEVFLIPAPYYTAFDHDMTAFTNCGIFRCPLLEQENGNFSFSVDVIKRGYEKATAQGLRPCGIVILNPQNPLGDIYDEQTIQPILEFAAEKKLHVIFDEIYAFSIFEKEKPFQSMLNYTSIIDPLRTHFVWSFSKDFALSGLRLGVVYAGSKELCVSGSAVNFIQVPSTIVQEILAELLSDHQWLEWYIQMNRSRLTERYEKVKKQIEELDQRIVIRPAQAGFFIWANLRSLLHEVTFEEETRLFDIMFEHKLYISPGFNMGCSEPGWFRFIFSIKEKWMNEGIRRFKLALDVYRNST